MKISSLGVDYPDQQIIYRQGEEGDCMYVIQQGKVEVYLEREGKEVPLKLCHAGEFLGILSLFHREVHTTSARTVGEARLLSIDKKNFLRRIQEDPTIAFRLVQMLSQRVKDLSEEVAVLNKVVQDCLEEQLRQGLTSAEPPEPTKDDK